MHSFFQFLLLCPCVFFFPSRSIKCILSYQSGLAVYLRKPNEMNGKTKWNCRCRTKCSQLWPEKNTRTHTHAKMAALRMGYWFVIMPAVAFQSLLTSRGNSIKPFITNVTTTAVCVFARMCFLKACVCHFMCIVTACPCKKKKKNRWMCVCGTRVPTTHPAGSFREGSDNDHQEEQSEQEGGGRCGGRRKRAGCRVNERSRDWGGGG